MNKSKHLSQELLAQDAALSGENYSSYRRQLDAALQRAERREIQAHRVCLISGIVSFTLMFVGGSKAFGSFDPWDKAATPVSILLGAVFWVSSIMYWVLLASYYSRLRPNTRRSQERVRDEQLQQLQRSVTELHDLILASRVQEPTAQRESNTNKS